MELLEVLSSKSFNSPLNVCWEISITSQGLENLEISLVFSPFNLALGYISFSVLMLGSIEPHCDPLIIVMRMDTHTHARAHTFSPDLILFPLFSCFELFLFLIFKCLY